MMMIMMMTNDDDDDDGDYLPQMVGTTSERVRA